jgi:hypothetical protein
VLAAGGETLLPLYGPKRNHEFYSIIDESLTTDSLTSQLDLCPNPPLAAERAEAIFVAETHSEDSPQ